MSNNAKRKQGALWQLSGVALSNVKPLGTVIVPRLKMEKIKEEEIKRREKQQQLKMLRRKKLANSQRNARFSSIDRKADGAD